MAEPIWRDKLYTLPSDKNAFRILCGNEVIYTGTAVKRPNASINQVRINDICADYIANSLPLLPTIPTLPVSFDIEIQAMGNWQLAGTIQFLNDWSYEDGYNPTASGMSFPILPIVARGQIVPFTRISSANVIARLYFSGTSTQKTMALPTDANKYTDSFIRTLATSGWGGVSVEVAANSSYTSMKIGSGREYEIRDCVKYVLYYINAYGGMDWFPILGNTQEGDSVERNVCDLDVNNTNRTRSRRELQNTITKTFTFHSGILTDEQSAMMHHLLDSTEVYLHDLVEQRVDPVLITSTSHDYPRFRNGKRPNEYTIMVEYANKHTR